MDAVNRNIHLLLNSIQKSDVYRTYKKQEAILEKNPEVNAYLDAELALCRMMQQICKTLTDGIEIKVPEI